MQAEPVPFDKIKGDVQSLIKKTIDVTLKDKKYDNKDAPNWAHSISEGIVKGLPDVSKDFKYSVTCIILSKTECGLHLCSSCFWNSQTDGSIVERWEGEMYCLVTVFGFAL